MTHNWDTRLWLALGRDRRSLWDARLWLALAVDERLRHYVSKVSEANVKARSAVPKGALGARPSEGQTRAVPPQIEPY